jgi:pre-rRNA-processing protein TSR4
MELLQVFQKKNIMIKIKFVTEGGDDELGQSNGPSTILPQEQNDKNKIPEINGGDFDLDALAEALEQSATLASNSKKKNKSKHANAPVKRPVLKAQACDLSIPGVHKFKRTRYHACKI